MLEKASTKGQGVFPQAIQIVPAFQHGKAVALAEPVRGAPYQVADFLEIIVRQQSAPVLTTDVETGGHADDVDAPGFIQGPGNGRYVFLPTAHRSKR